MSKFRLLSKMSFMFKVAEQAVTSQLYRAVNSGVLSGGQFSVWHFVMRHFFQLHYFRDSKDLWAVNRGSKNLEEGQRE